MGGTCFQSRIRKIVETKNIVCPTRWSSRVTAIRAIKNRYLCILKVLCKISLTSNSTKERADANGLRKKIETFEFLVFLVFWERLLLVIDRASRELQSSEMDLGRAAILLRMAMKDLEFLRSDWKSITLTASAIAINWKVEARFVEKRAWKIKKFYDELSNDERLINPEDAFRAHVFYPAVDTALNQLRSRFKGQQAVCEAFDFLMPSNLAEHSSRVIHDGVTSLSSLLCIHRTSVVWMTFLPNYASFPVNLRKICRKSPLFIHCSRCYENQSFCHLCLKQQLQYHYF